MPGHVRPLKLLFVTPYLPSPPGFGGARRLHGLFTGLARKHEVSVLALANPEESHEASLKATREYCREVEIVPNPPFALSLRGKRALQLRSLFSAKSFEWVSHVRPELRAALRGFLAREKHDVVTFEFTHMAPYRTEVGIGPDAPLCVLDEHNIEYEILRRTAASETALLRRLYNAVNWRKLHSEELAAWRAFDGCTVTSVHDRDLLLRSLPHTRTSVVPNGVDLDFFKPGPGAAVEPDTLLFFGAINYFPNTDGLRFFLEEIFPLVRARRPRARLSVVGHTPDHIRALASEHVLMKGFVPDVRAEIERAAVVIAPLRVGGGTRLKIVEAMSMARPVVSTPQGAEGLEVSDSRDLFIASTPAAFADKVVRLLQDAALAGRMGDQARRLVEQRYGWAAAVSQLESFYDELGAGRARAD
jgi:glycosyltransferase involved in cell wall biosynthesis